ncbi:hypothetical protein [Parendozoicomonas haliclonae]|uniref:Uncharacterized protein n=1 Tax=Parendozoicomonas haliclonae TaxID=1960125 RepID=A0A1X7AHU5_9GAMM|nr:hypothetical protein [Parendozoicomonas haliclonae]SMA42220.1 hypothetical protein EHSB41UT_01405 [Parendozoicomonas haliclonae]
MHTETSINLNKEMLDLMSILRRRLKAEFDVIIRFSHDDALETIYDLARRSMDQTTKENACHLLTLSGWDIEIDQLIRPVHSQRSPAGSPPPAQPKAVKIYRGQVIA